MKILAKLLGVAVVVATGCVTSEPIDLRGSDAAGQPAQPILATGAGGDPGVSGQAGTGATPGTSGAAGAAAGAPGGPGSGAAGSPTAGAAGGAAGAAGGTGSGSGGSRDAGAPADANVVTDAAGSEVSAYAATWTDIYNKMLNNMSYASNCTGSACHNPGKQKGIDLSSQTTGYTTMKGHLIVGNPTSSQLVQKLSSGSMPAGRPKMPTADLNVIKAWIMAGALNN